MFNKDFKQDWKVLNYVNLINAKHLDININKSCFSVGLTVSWTYRTIRIAIAWIEIGICQKRGKYMDEIIIKSNIELTFKQSQELCEDYCYYNATSIDVKAHCVDCPLYKAINRDQEG